MIPWHRTDLADCVWKIFLCVKSLCKLLCKLDELKDCALRSYIFVPILQYMIPSMIAIAIVTKILIPLYSGLHQYDLCFFHMQMMNCTRKLCGYRVTKLRSLDPGCALLNSRTRNFVLLQHQVNIRCKSITYFSASEILFGRVLHLYISEFLYISAKLTPRISSCTLLVISSIHVAGLYPSFIFTPTIL